MNSTNNNSITPSKEDYLRVIYELSECNKKVHSSDVAEKLGITRASVSRMMSELKTSGLIEKEKYGSISLTKEGYKIAAQIKDKHDIIVSFLVEVLEIEKADAKKDACKMEHAISAETAERLNRVLKNKEGIVCLEAMEPGL
jgi:Mn-dependent DtxR family transcriptional regulator